jgi:hypothetical protein
MTKSGAYSALRKSFGTCNPARILDKFRFYTANYGPLTYEQNNDCFYFASACHGIPTQILDLFRNANDFEVYETSGFDRENQQTDDLQIYRTYDDLRPESQRPMHKRLRYDPDTNSLVEKERCIIL